MGAVRAIPHIRDPWGFFFSHNKALVMDMVKCPELARAARMVCEGANRWMWSRGVAAEDLDVVGMTTRDGYIVIKLGKKEDQG